LAQIRVAIHAWVEDEATKKLVAEGLSDRKLAKSQIKVEIGDVDEAVRYYGDNPTPNIIILDSKVDGDALLANLEKLAEVCDAGTSVVVIGEANDIHLYRSLIKRGISDYFCKPFAPRQVYEAVAAICIDPNAPPLARTIAFIASRGGAGSSSLAHNVAWHLGQEFREEVVLMDLDITFGTAGLAFNVETPQGIHTALAEPDRLDDVLLERFLAEYDEHVKLLVSPAQLSVEEKLYMDALDRLLELVRRRSSFVVLDVPHRWAPWAQQLLLDADEVVVVGSLDLASLRDTKNLVERLREKRGDAAPVHMVLNKAGAAKRTELSPKDFENATQLKPDAVVPYHPDLFGQASNNGQMLGEVNKRHRVVDAVRQLAIQLSGRRPAAKKKSILSALQLPKLTLMKAKAKGA
jgi:pilus assembly protein CpaE